MTLNAIIGLVVLSALGGVLAYVLVTYVPALDRLTRRALGGDGQVGAGGTAAVSVADSTTQPASVVGALMPAATEAGPAPAGPPQANDESALAAKAAAPGADQSSTAIKPAAIAVAPVTPPNSPAANRAAANVTHAPTVSAALPNRQAARAPTAPERSRRRVPEQRPLYKLEDGSVPLVVPFADNERVSALGARWNKEANAWVVPADTFPEPFMEWWAKAPLSDLPGEDRGFGGNQLYVDLVPSSCWFTNVRSCVEPRDWDRLRRYVYNRAGNKCEVCDESGERIDAHERWEYDDATKTQVLRRLVCLCQPCHQATHFGLALSRGLDEEAARHIALVNCWSPAQVAQHVTEAFAVWETRNAIAWDLDLSMITKAGIAIVDPIAAADRQAAAEEAFAEAS